LGDVVIRRGLSGEGRLLHYGGNHSLDTMGPNRRALQREEARAREAQRQREQEASALDIAEAAEIIKFWNERLASGRPVLFSPTLRAAAMAGYRWLTVHCRLRHGQGHRPGQNRSPFRCVDHEPHPRTVVPHCRPNAPFARLKGLSRS